MKKVLFVLMCMCVTGVMTSFADVVVYENDYNGETSGAGLPAWNWIDGDTAGGFVKSHTAVYEDWGDGLSVVHTGTIDNSAGTTAVNCRFGSKWDLTMSGNTSSNAADYTISFDIWNAMGNWDPIRLEFFVLTGTGNAQGKGSGGMDFAQVDEWVHVEKNLADLPVNWWNGTGWVLTDSLWHIEVGGPGWPGTSVPAGTPAWEQIWLMDNLQITMPEPASLVLLGLGSLTMLRKRK